LRSIESKVAWPIFCKKEEEERKICRTMQSAVPQHWLCHWLLVMMWGSADVAGCESRFCVVFPILGGPPILFATLGVTPRTANHFFRCVKPELFKRHASGGVLVDAKAARRTSHTHKKRSTGLSVERTLSQLQ